MERLTARLPNGVVKRTEVYGDSVMLRLAAYEDALTLPDGTVMGPSEVAALRKRCEAAEADLLALLAQPDYVGVCGACAKDCHKGDECDPVWRGPQEGATK